MHCVYARSYWSCTDSVFRLASAPPPRAPTPPPIAPLIKACGLAVNAPTPTPTAAPSAVPPMVPRGILAAFECVRSAAQSRQASSCALNAVKLVCGLGRTVVRGYFGVQATALMATKTNSVVVLKTFMMLLLRVWQNTGDPTA